MHRHRSGFFFGGVYACLSSGSPYAADGFRRLMHRASAPPARARWPDVKALSRCRVVEIDAHSLHNTGATQKSPHLPRPGQMWASCCNTSKLLANAEHGAAAAVDPDAVHVASPRLAFNTPRPTDLLLQADAAVRPDLAIMTAFII